MSKFMKSLCKIAIPVTLQSMTGKNFEKSSVRRTDLDQKMKWYMRGSQSLGPHWSEVRTSLTQLEN